MKAKIRKDGGRILAELPAEAQFQEGAPVDIFVLRPGMILLCTQPAKSEVFGHREVSSLKSSLPPQEQAVLSKLARIRFFERNQMNVQSSFSDEEKAILESLISKNAVSLFKSPRYPDGVYNISNKYFASRSAPQPNSVQTSQTADFDSAPAQTFNANSLPGPALAINTIEHLKKLGYMVLSNEGEAKYLMEKIKQELKGEEIKGVRGFDKKYYVLRKSFLMEFEQPVFELLDSGKIKADAIAKQLNLTSEAITAMLIIMADEGLVIEPRRGEWAKA